MHSKVIGMVVLGAVSVGILGCGGAAVESGSPTTTLESGSPSTPAAPNVATATISDPSGSGSSTRSIAEDTLPKTEPLMPAATTGARLSETPTLDEVVAELGFEGTIEWDSSKPDGMPRKLLDTTHINDLGWFPTIKLRYGLTTTYQWYVEDVA